MLHLYLFSLLSGLVVANGMPHFIKGVIGQKHHTPFGKGSSALVNVLWGWFNFVVGGYLLHFGHPHAHELRAFGVFAVGVLITSLFCAYTWSTHPEYNK